MSLTHQRTVREKEGTTFSAPKTKKKPRRSFTHVVQRQQARSQLTHGRDHLRPQQQRLRALSVPIELLALQFTPHLVTETELPQHLHGAACPAGLRRWANRGRLQQQ